MSEIHDTTNAVVKDKCYCKNPMLNVKNTCYQTTKYKESLITNTTKSKAFFTVKKHHHKPIKMFTIILPYRWVQDSQG